MKLEELDHRILFKTQEREQHLANANVAQGAINELTAWRNLIALQQGGQPQQAPVKPKRGRKPKAPKTDA